MAESSFAELPDVDVRVYAPHSEYHNAPKREGVKELTPARALIAGSVRRYAALGLDCTNLEVHKLAWFITRSVKRMGLPDPLALDFAANKYGPYADRLRHLLNGLDGSYLHCEKRLADAGPMDLIWFEDGQGAEVDEYLRSASANIYYPALEKTDDLIDGFQTPLGLEVLAKISVTGGGGRERSGGAGIGLSENEVGGQREGRQQDALHVQRSPKGNETRGV